MAYYYRWIDEELSGLGDSIVTMMQPAESREGKDVARGCRTSREVRCSLLESEMCPVVMIVAGVICEQPFQKGAPFRGTVAHSATMIRADKPSVIFRDVKTEKAHPIDFGDADIFIGGFEVVGV